MWRYHNCLRFFGWRGSIKFLYVFTFCSFPLYCKCFLSYMYSFMIFISLYFLCSTPFYYIVSVSKLYVFFPDIRLLIFLMFILKFAWTFNYMQTLILPNTLWWIKLKQVFYDRFLYLFPEGHLESSATSTIEFFPKIVKD